jgi:hypothetical protein
MRFSSKWILVLGMTAGLLAAAASPISRAQTPEATLELSGGADTVGVGYTWARGTLYYRGVSYPFRVNGLGAVDVQTALQASGVVQYLENLEDFDGTYTEVEVNAALAAAGCTGSIENEHGVVIGLQSTTQGLRFAPSLIGVSIGLDGRSR